MVLVNEQRPWVRGIPWPLLGNDECRLEIAHEASSDQSGSTRQDDVLSRERNGNCEVGMLVPDHLDGRNHLG